MILQAETHFYNTTIKQRRALLVKSFECVVAQWCDSLTWQLEQSGGQRSRPGRAQSHPDLASNVRYTSVLIKVSVK